MVQHKETVPVDRIIVTILVFLNAVIAKIALIRNENWYWALVVTVPLLLIAVWDMRERKHAIPRNYPVPGPFLYSFKYVRPEKRPYFFETDFDGTPFNRRQRSVIHQRAKIKSTITGFEIHAD